MPGPLRRPTGRPAYSRFAAALRAPVRQLAICAARRPTPRRQLYTPPPAYSPRPARRQRRLPAERVGSGAPAATAASASPIPARLPMGCGPTRPRTVRLTAAARATAATAPIRRTKSQGAGHRFFGSISQGLASVIEHAFQQPGPAQRLHPRRGCGRRLRRRPALRPGHALHQGCRLLPVYWQGPSIGFDYGAEGSKVMILVYNLRDTRRHLRPLRRRRRLGLPGRRRRRHLPRGRPHHHGADPLRRRPAPRRQRRLPQVQPQADLEPVLNPRFALLTEATEETSPTQCRGETFSGARRSEPGVEARGARRELSPAGWPRSLIRGASRQQGRARTGLT